MVADDEEGLSWLEKLGVATDTGYCGRGRLVECKVYRDSKTDSDCDVGG